MTWATLVLWLHLLAATCWVGSQLFLVLVALPTLSLRLAGAERVRVTARVGRRFVAFSAVALAVLVISSPLNAIVHGIPQATLRGAAWGAVLLPRIGLLGIMLALIAAYGAYAGRKLEMLNVAAQDRASAARRGALLRQSVRLSITNLLLNLAIAGLAAWLGTLS